jgi:hypothetical protein
VFASFSAILKGLPTIRAYNAQHQFHDKFLRQLSDNGSWYHLFLAVSRFVLPPLRAPWLTPPCAPQIMLTTRWEWCNW